MDNTEWDDMVLKVSKILKAEYETKGDLYDKIQELIEITREIKNLEQKVIEQRLNDSDLKKLNIHRAQKISEQINAGVHVTGIGHDLDAMLSNYYFE